MYQFRVDWHQDDRVVPLVRQYQLALDAALAECSDLADCAVGCCHCGIRFLTHPRNARRIDLRCPFGCRTHHRRQLARERQRTYCRSDKGRRLKKRRNAARQQRGCSSHDAAWIDPTRVDAHEPLAGSVPESYSCEAHSLPACDRSAHVDSCSAARSLSVPVSVLLDGFVLHEATLRSSPVIPHLLLLFQLLAGLRLSRDELLSLLCERMRQRSMGRLSRREYLLLYLQQHPP